MQYLVPLCTLFVFSLHSALCGPKDESARVGEHNPRFRSSRVTGAAGPHPRRHNHGQPPGMINVPSDDEDEDDTPPYDYQSDARYDPSDQPQFYNLGRLGDSNKNINDKLKEIRRQHNLGNVDPVSDVDFDLGLNYTMLLQRYPNCSVCRNREWIKQYQIEVIKEKILSMLRLKAPPNITGPIPDINIQALEYYNQLGPHHEDKDDDNFVQTGVLAVGQTVTNTFNLPNDNHNINTDNVVYFNISEDEVARGRQGKTRLMLFVRHRASGDNVVLLIYKIIQLRNGTLHKKVVSSLKQKIELKEENTGKWYNFNIKGIVQEWIRHPETNLGLEIIANDHRGEQIVVIDPKDTTEQGFKPLVSIAIKDGNDSRKKRSGGMMIDCPDDSTEERCCRYKLVIDFLKLGWDFIVAPTTYQSFYCSGTCPLTFEGDSSSWLVQQTLTAHRQKPPEALLCCHPTGKSPLSLVYIDNDDKIKFGILPDMKTNKCGCD